MIEYLSLKKVTSQHEEEIQEAVRQVVASGWYLQGQSVARFEQQYADYIGTRHCVGCGNGYDALWLILRAYKELGVLQDGDEVIVPANTYIATILAISDNQLTPILVEPSLETLEIDDTLIEQAITPRTRALMIVHLYGRCAYTQHIGELCQKYNLKLIEDNAQAHGCTFEGRRTGSLGHAAAHSFYPGKNLGALGDGGAVTTDDEALAQMVHSIGNYGSSRKYVFPYRGRNSRLDELQAAVLSVKLKYLDEDNLRRKTLANILNTNIKHPDIKVPNTPGTDNVYHIYPILCSHRDELQAFLRERGIQTMVHYPIPPHQQEAYHDWHARSYPITEQIHQQELSLPCNQTMSINDAQAIAQAVNDFKFLV